ncbi:MAG: zinc-binding dehydrogenase [Candidatus Omnitrophica bacterium]|nr:zinc-binding dehydrogenase [Candidatus Omnitrophota bacterium]
MERKVKSIVFTEPGEIELQTFDLSDCGKDEIICKTIYTFVSPGTELRVLSGISESKGKFPLIPGYSWVGKIIETGSDVKGWKIGELVTGRNVLPVQGINQLWGGQSGYHRTLIKGYDSALKLPESVDPWDYVHTEVAAIAYRGVSCAYPSEGETAIVIGQGMIGAFVARWLLYYGARVIVMDIVESRLERARKWGVTAAITGGASDTREQILAYCPEGADIVIEASSSIAGAKLAGSLLRQPVPRTLNRHYAVSSMHSNAHLWPRLVFLATYTDTLEMGPAGLSQVEGSVVLKPGDRTVNDRLEVIDKIKKGCLPVKDIIEKPVPVDECVKAYKNLRDEPGKYSTLAFEW